MAGKKKIMLFKIASEINIGKDAIVEFLQSKDFDIENKPTASLDEDMYNAVLEKFKKERIAAEKQREKIQKHKDIRKTADMKDKAKQEELNFAEPASMHEAAEKPAAAEKTAEAPVVAGEAPHEAAPHEAAPHEAAAEVTLPPETPRRAAEARPAGDKPAGEAAKPLEPLEEARTEEAVRAAEPLPEAQPQQKEIAAAETAKAKPHKPRPAAQEKVEPAEQEEIEIVISPRAESAAKSAELPGIEENMFIDEPLIPQVEDKAATEREYFEEIKKAKKRKKLIEVVPGETPQLRGLTIVGKINIEPEKLKKEKAKPKKKVKTVEEDEEAIKIKTKGLKKRKKGKEAEAPAPAAERPKEGGKFGVKAKPGASGAERAEEKKRKKKKKSIREMITEEEVDKAIRATLIGMEGTHAGTSRAKIRQKKKLEREEKETRIQEEKLRDASRLMLTEFVTTSDLANIMGIPANEIIVKCMQLGLMVTINQRLDKDTITLIADDYGFEAEFVDDDEITKIEEEEEEDEYLLPRSPIVTIMGHVDHGKTSLLDFIRKSNVVAGEAGGITQHIGAYQVKLPSGKSITFLDTPGHEAFTAMRARGAQVTDIVVLVVAADDSVMPQTIEAISHARAANVPIVVAINKIDKPDANPDRIKQQLTDHQILVEDWGGKNQSAEISAKHGLNVEVLLEKILLEAELLDLKANPDRNARGVVVEANMSKGLGSVATIIVQKGTLHVGDPFVSGAHFGKVRALLDERGNKVESAGPSSPVRVIGYDGLPEAGDTFVIVDSETEARQIATERRQLRREQELRQVHHVTLDEISAQIQMGGVKDLNLIIKGDVSGSVEAIGDSLQKLSREEVRVNILHKGVGPITETDVMLAAASSAVVIGFCVTPTVKARKLADSEKIDIRNYNIIYDCINEIQLALEGMLTPDYKEEITSTVEIRKVFRISRLGSIAGCYVLNGKITRNDKVRVLRDGLTVFEGSIHSLKRGKDDVKEVDTGYECGIQLEGFNDVNEGDYIEGFKLVEVRRRFK